MWDVGQSFTVQESSTFVDGIKHFYFLPMKCLEQLPPSLVDPNTPQLKSLSSENHSHRTMKVCGNKYDSIVLKYDDYRNLHDSYHMKW